MGLRTGMKSFGNNPVPMKGAIAAILLVVGTFGVSYATLSDNTDANNRAIERVSQQSRRDVQDVVAKAYKACSVLVLTRTQNIAAWTHLFDTLEDVATNPESDALFEELRQQILDDLPAITIDECFTPLDE